MSQISFLHVDSLLCRHWVQIHKNRKEIHEASEFPTKSHILSSNNIALSPGSFSLECTNNAKNWMWARRKGALLILITCMMYMDMVWCDSHWYVMILTRCAHAVVVASTCSSLVSRLPESLQRSQSWKDQGAATTGYYYCVHATSQNHYIQTNACHTKPHPCTLDTW